MGEALALARLGARLATQAQHGGHPDEVSRLALMCYLELMPKDTEVREALERIPPVVAAQPRQPRWRLGVLLIAACAFSAGAAAYLRRSPDVPQLAAAPAPVAVVPPPPAPPLDPTPPPLPRSEQTAVEALANPPAPTAVRQPDPPAMETAVADSAQESPITIRAVGDVVLGSDYPGDRLPGAEEKKRIAALRDELRQADIVVGNLEGVLSNEGRSRKDLSRAGFYSFRMPARYATTLREMGFDVMSLANNHSLDFGQQGLESTVKALRAEGIRPVGVPGAELALVKVRNTTAAFLNYSYLPAFARLDDEQRVVSEIGNARELADLVIVTVHGGKEGASAAGAPSGDEYFRNEYRGDLRRFAYLAVDAGACAVFGHGPHVVRPFEIYKERPLFFSLGNFVGYRSLSTQGRLANSIIAEVRFSPQGQFLGAGVIPLKLDQSGIPSVDYSIANLNALDGLLESRLDKRPVLELARPPSAGSTTGAATQPAATAGQG